MLESKQGASTSKADTAMDTAQAEGSASEEPSTATSGASCCTRASSDCKRQRGDAGSSPSSGQATSHQPDDAAAACLLFGVPSEVLELVLSFLGAQPLAMLASTCKHFQAKPKDKKDRLPLVHKTARDQLVRLHGPVDAARWRHSSWLERLQIEETATGFDRARCEQQGFVFTRSPCQRGVIKLEVIGPKMLVSDLSTADVPLLRWRLELQGNNAVEFGTVPVALQDRQKALHKCYNDSTGARPSGFCSSITVGSMLPVKLPLMRGSIVEIIARRDRLLYIVTNPPNGMEMTWQNTVTIPKPYTGPLEFRFEQDLPPEQPVKLAITCWARATFGVLHSPPEPPQPPSTSTQQQQQFGASIAELAGLEAVL